MGNMMPMNTSKSTHTALAFAALSVELGTGTVPAEVRLLPAGKFRAWDGRPTECASWVMTDEDGARIVAEASARESAYVIDYEHSTLHAKKSGEKAVAAAWFKQLEWRTGDGLYAIGVDWTALAAQHIADREYRYLSPLFTYSATTGRVGRLVCAALTNNPGLDGLTDLAALAADFFLNQQPTEVPAVNEELLEQLRWLLNLPVGTTAEDIAAHLSKLIIQLKGDGTAAAAVSFDLPGHLAALSAQVAQPDPAKFVPVAALSALQGEHAEALGRLAALSAEIDGGKLDKIIADGRDAGKLTPATEPWARDLGKKDIAALSAFIAAAPVVVALGDMQTKGVKPKGGLDAGDSKAIAQAALSYQAEQLAVGINISTVQAVTHVFKKGNA